MRLHAADESRRLSAQAKSAGDSGDFAEQQNGVREVDHVGRRVALPPTRHKTDRTDSYGRTLAYLVEADGSDYSVEAARAVAAHPYVYGDHPVSRHDAIAVCCGPSDRRPFPYGVVRRHAFDNPLPPWLEADVATAARAILLDYGSKARARAP